MVWGQTGICLAAEYLLDFYSVVWLLLESWKRASETGACDFSVGSSDHGVTYAFMPSEKILFGILTFTGTAMLFLIPLSKVLERIPAWAGFAGSFLLFGLTRNVNRGVFGFELLHFGRVPKVLYRGLFMTFLGFPDPGFFSGDYFPLFPWIFLYLTGYFLYGMFMKFPEVKKALAIHLPVPFLETAGRHSLLLYLLHQPLLMLVFTAADVLKIL